MWQLHALQGDKKKSGEKKTIAFASLNRKKFLSISTVIPCKCYGSLGDKAH